jgi:hypothetical protein
MVVPSDADPDADIDPEPGAAPELRPRPRQVTIASFILFFIAASWLLAGIANLFASRDEEVLRANDVSATTAVVFGLAFLVLAGVNIAAGVLVRRGHNVARIVAIGASVLGVLYPVLGILSLAADVAVVYLLLGPQPSREFFARPAPAEP